MSDAAMPSRATVGSPGPVRRGAWFLARLEAEAFGGTAQVREQWPLFRRSCLRAAMLLAILGSARRVNSGSAVCLLRRWEGRSMLRAVAWAAAVAVAVLVVFVALGVLWRPLPYLLYLAAAAVFVVPCAWSMLRNSGGRRALRGVSPPRPWVFVHGVARIPGEEWKGAGAEVMWPLVAEADRHGWQLVLDAAAPKLVEYYERFGFVACGEPVAMSWGSVVRMVRAPACREVSDG